MTTGIPGGLGGTLGFAIESTVGAFQTPVTFITFNKDSVKTKKNIVQGQGLHGGEYLLASRRESVTHTADGTISTDLYDRGLGKIWKGCLGAASAPLPIGATSAYCTVFTPADLTGYSLGFQIGKPSVNGTINPFSYEGCKITDWTLGVNNKSQGTLDIGIDSWFEDVSQTYTAPSYVASNMLSFNQATLTIGGTVAPFATTVASGSNGVNTSTFSGSGTLNVAATAGMPSAGTITVVTGSTPATITYSGLTSTTFTGCTTTSGGGVMSTGGAVTSTYTTLTGGTSFSTATGATIKGMNKIADERFYLGSAGTKAEQLANGFRGISGTVDSEFRQLADMYTAFAADTATSLQLSFVGPTIASSVTSEVVVLIPRIYWDDASPNVEGPDLLKEPGAFTGLDDGINPPVQITTYSLDSAI